MTNLNESVPAATKLRELLAEKDKIVVCPGVYDGFTARIALASGFDCLYMVDSLSMRRKDLGCILIVYRQEQVPQCPC